MTGIDDRPDLWEPVLVVVEDSEVDVEILRSAAARSPHCPEVVAYRTGEAAVEAILAEPTKVQLVLLDLNLPGLDGFEVLAALRTDPNTNPIPIVVLTSSAADTDIARASRLGANAYVLKPLGLAAHVELLDDLCRFWRRALRPAGTEPARGADTGRWTAGRVGRPGRP